MTSDTPETERSGARPSSGSGIEAGRHLDAEDNKLLTLARGAMARAGAAAGAAVRDSDGRTYAAGPVELAALQLSALQVAVAMAISSGAEGLEAGLLVGGSGTTTGDRVDTDPGLAALTEVSSSAYAIVADAQGGNPRRLDRE